MLPLNDKDLDRLSRDAADQYNVEPSASGWERIEKRLNKELPLKDEKDRKRFLLWLFFIALLSGGALTYMLTDKPASGTYAQQKVSTALQKDKSTAGNELTNTETATPKQIPFKNSKDEITEPADELVATQETTTNQPTITTGKNETSPVKTNPVVQKATRNNSRDVAIAGNKKAITQKNTPQNNSTAGIKQDPVKGNKDAKNNNTSPVVADNKRSHSKEKEVVAGNEKQVSAGKTGKNNNNTEEETAVTKTNDVATEAIDKKITGKTDIPLASDSAAKEQGAPETVAAGKKTTQSKGKKDFAPFEIGLITGPDFSNVNFKYAYKTGINLGLYLGYRFSDRVSVNSGFIYTKKFYKAGGEDFHAPKHTWLSYQDIQMVKGYCSMYEIPVNVRYDVAVQKQSRFFINGGVSNYLMNKENYECDYINNIGTAENYKWSRDSTSTYMFSVINISAGFEQNLDKHFSIQAEPYLKVPLKGMGYGNMNLDSYGIYVTLKYKPFLKKK